MDGPSPSVSISKERDVDGEDEIEVLLSQFVRRATHRNAGVVDQDVDARHGSENAFGKGRTCSRWRQVSFQNDRVVAEVPCHPVEICDSAPG